jgi:hypothetical protein
MRHKCIRVDCPNFYEDEELDAYYCESCKVQNKEIAKKLDAQFVNRPKQVKSDLQLYDELRGSGKFPNARDMGF